MNINHLTLAENKLLLSPETSGFVLFELSLLELLLQKKLTFISSRANDREKKINGFLKLNCPPQELAKNIVYWPIVNTLRDFPQLQLSRLVKTCNKLFKKDFEHYKNDYVLKRLKEKHAIIKDNLFNSLFKKTELTDKGINYQKQLAQTLSSQKDKLQNASTLSANQLQGLLFALGANILLFGKSYLKELESIDLHLINSQLIDSSTFVEDQATKLTDFLDLNMLTDLEDYCDSFIYELPLDDLAGAVNAGLELSSLLSNLDFSGLAFIDF